MILYVFFIQANMSCYLGINLYRHVVVVTYILSSKDFQNGFPNINSYTKLKFVFVTVDGF